TTTRECLQSRQITPSQRQLLGPSPSLDLSFPLVSRESVWMSFAIHEPDQASVEGSPGTRLSLDMFARSPGEVVGHPDIEIPVLELRNVDPVASRRGHEERLRV